MKVEITYCRGFLREGLCSVMLAMIRSDDKRALLLKMRSWRGPFIDRLVGRRDITN
jgi:hypothetical protein